MSSFVDDEFGSIHVTRSLRNKSVKLSMSSNGTVRVSMPNYAPLFLAKRLLESSRESLRKAAREHPSRIIFTEGMQVGKSHSLLRTPASKLEVRTSKQLILVSLPDHIEMQEPQVQSAIREVVVKILRKEAKSYLPRRLQYLAGMHGLTYERVRFSYASTRWGSCSSSGTISLNISLMMLPFELIDYVILHELAHTKHMNHSQAFWSLVERLDPDYRIHRKALKNYSSQL